MTSQRPSISPSTDTRRTISYAVHLTCEIQKAVETTVQTITSFEKKATRRFLGKYDLSRILTERSLEQLFEELLQEIRSESGSHVGLKGRENETTNRMSDYIDRTIGSQSSRGSPSRRELLALFLYLNYKELLFLFVEWIEKGFPSTESLPFTSSTLKQWDIPPVYHPRIEADQAIFCPKVIQRGENHVFKEGDRLPFIGLPPPVGKGNVFITTIARSHWEIKANPSDRHFIPGNPESEMVVAVKTFKAIERFVTTHDAASEFQAECKILDKLHKSDTRHGKILLDWGRITIQDVEGTAISHSLIFERASGSLEDFLKDQGYFRNYFRTYGTAKNAALLTHLTGIVGALQCLHVNLDTYHFDIKPENILVFEEELGPDESEHQGYAGLIWKLTDFGLAEKVEKRRQRYKNEFSTSVSTSNAIPAKRPAGTFQAPEIQQLNSGQASWRSDVWSMGCVALMVLAYVVGGPGEVKNLEFHSTVDYEPSGSGSEALFYIRNDTLQWHDVHHFRYQYLPSFTPEVTEISGLDTPRQFQAAVNPHVINWSNKLLNKRIESPQKDLFRRTLGLVFTRVLRIDRRQRLSTSEFLEELDDIQSKFKRVEDNPGDEHNFRPAPEASEGEASDSVNRPRDIEAQVQAVRTLERTASTDWPTPQVGIGVISKSRNSDPHSGDSIRDTGEDDKSSQSEGYHAPLAIPSTRQRQVESDVLRNNLAQTTTISSMLSSMPSTDTSLHPEGSDLYSTIESNEYAEVKMALKGDLEQLKRPISNGYSSYLPIHWAIRSQKYRALDALLEIASAEALSQKDRGKTAFELACTLKRGGDTGSLKCFQKHRDNPGFRDVFQQSVTDEHMEKLSREAKTIVQGLCKTPVVKSPPTKSTRRFSMWSKR